MSLLLRIGRKDIERLENTSPLSLLTGLESPTGNGDGCETAHTGCHEGQTGCPTMDGTSCSGSTNCDLSTCVAEVSFAGEQCVDSSTQCFEASTSCDSTLGLCTDAASACNDTVCGTEASGCVETSTSCAQVTR